MRNLLLAIALLIAIVGRSQSFEGKIYIVKSSISDTIYFTYSVKDKYIRIDEYNKRNNIEESIIFDLERSTIVALSPAKKLYTHITPASRNKENDHCMIIKSSNYKMINGFKCYQWRVRNTALNSEVSYWVTKHEFQYFDELLRLWHSHDTNLTFYLELPESGAYLPMLTVERTLLRDEKLRMAIVDIEHTKLDDSIFIIPSHFKNFRTTSR